MALTIGGVTAQFKTGWSLPGVTQEVAVRQHTVTFDSSYPTGGEAIAASDFGLTTITEIWITQPVGYQVEYDKDNGKLKVFYPGRIGGPAPAAATITDDDNAATNGVAVYVHSEESVFEEQAQIGHLEFVSPTNADGSDTFGDSTLHVLDDDAAATGGAALFVAPAGGGLYANTGETVHVPLADGSMILVTHDADPGTNQSAVQVYFDEDGTAGGRFQAVVADNLDEAVTLAQQGWNQSALAGEVATEVTAATDLSSLAVRVMVIGY